VSACLPHPVHDLGHHRVVANRKRDEAGPRSRVSAWLPPGLALGWLALLATFVHGAGTLLAVWAATTALAVLFGQRGTAGPITDSPKASRHPDEAPDRASATAAARTSRPARQSTATSSSDKDEGAHFAAPQNATGSMLHAPGSSSDARPMVHDRSPKSQTAPTVSGLAGHSDEQATADLAVTLGLRVLTAAEVASVLRVDASEVVEAISDGELPGNRIGIHWRVEHRALVRWLQGGYPAVRGANPDSTQR
jgi:excisionase family DNA binding protein